jgi:hypothetical protein
MLRTVLAVTWLVLGVALLAWCVWGAISSWHYFHFASGGFKASIIAGTFSVLVMLGALLALRSRTLGSWLLNAGAVVAVLYALAYLFLGGYEDAPLQAPAVAVLAVLAFATLYAFRNVPGAP